MQPPRPGAPQAEESHVDTTRSFDGDSEKSFPIMLARGEEPLPRQVGRFLIRKKLGQGGYGAVYLAYDPTLEREIALKLPRQKGFWSVVQTQEFLKEARIAARLKHPHVITIYDADACDEHGIFIAMEHVAGETLAQRLRRGKLSVEETVRLGGQIAEAIHQGHKLGLVHRDLKPSNILLDEAGNAKVCDFGLAIDENAQRSEHRDFSGTWPYMSPEQFAGETHRLDGRSDLWSLGVVLYECLAGRRPFRGETWDEIRTEVLTHDPKPLRQLDDRIPAELDALCRRCLQRDLKERIPTAHDVARALAAVGGRPPLRRPGLIAATVVLAAVAIVAAAIAATRGFSDPEGQREPAAPNVAAARPPSKPAEPTAVPGGPSAGAQAAQTPPRAVQSLVRPRGRGTTWRQLPSGTGIQAETQTVDLLQLGQLAAGDLLEIELRQPRWTGGAGLFFGHHSVVVEGVESYQFHALVVERDRRGGWQLIRFQYQYPFDNPEFWSGEVLAAVPIPNLKEGPVQLRVRLAGEALEAIEIDGQPQPVLTDMSAKSIPPAANGSGPFGLLLNHSGGSAGNIKINGRRLSVADPPADAPAPP